MNTVLPPHAKCVSTSCAICVPDPVVVLGLDGYYVRSFEHDFRTKPRRTREQALTDWDALASGAFV